MNAVSRALWLLYRAVALVLVASAAGILLLLALGIRPYAVLTGSMEPAIPEGSLCFVNQRASFDNLREGDVIAFRMGELLVTHRVVRIDPEGVTTRGDANNAADQLPKVTQETFVGRALFWLPWAGKLLLYARSAKGRWVVAAALILFLALGFISDKRR